MSLKTCIPKLHSLLKDFDLSEIETAAADYQEAGMPQQEAELRAINDRLRELRAEKGRIEAIVIEAFKAQDPEGYAEAQGGAIPTAAAEAGAGETAETEEERLRRLRERMSREQEERRARVKAIAQLFEANGAVEGHYKSNPNVQIILSRNTYPGGEKFRVTSFDENGPMGHREYATVEGAAAEFNGTVAVRGLDSDFVAPGGRPGQGEANLEAMFDELLAEETQRGQGTYEVLRRIPQPDGMEIHVFRNDKGVAAGLYDADAEKYVDQSITIYSGADALQKATAKAEAMVAEGVLPPAIGVAVNSEPPRRRPPRRPAQGAQPRTAAEALGSAAENTAEGLANAIKGLGELFGGGGKLSSGLTFDEQTYERAKPLFIQALRDFKDAAADLREAMRAIIRMVVEQFGADAANNMRPYVVRFMQDVQAGRIELAGEADVPGTGEAQGDPAQDDFVTGQQSDADYLRSLFEGDEQQVLGGDAAEQAPVDTTRLRRAIATARTQAQERYDDWAGRDYKANKKQVGLAGDGPSRRESMSVGAINEGRRQRVLAGLSRELSALDRLGQEVATDDGAQRLARRLGDIMRRAREAEAAGTDPNLNADQLFERMVIVELGADGGASGSVMSNGVSRALLDVVKGAGARTEQARPGDIGNFGEALPPARRALAAKLDEDLADNDIANRPLSEIWPISENEAIEDTFAAAVAHAARDEIPAKPRKSYKLRSWVEKVQTVRKLAAMVLDGRLTRDVLAQEIASGKRASLRDWWSKVQALEMLPRDSWKRIEAVQERPDAYSYVGDQQTPSPMLRVIVDGNAHWLRGDPGIEGNSRGALAGNLNGLKALLGAASGEKRLQFEARRESSTGRVFVNKKGDPERRRLMEFATGKEALDAIRTQYEALEAAWEAVKAQDNITERDLRSAENRPRAGREYRGGKDVAPQDFQRVFGFRGGEFGNWVQQGKGDKQRQALLNNAYDALMDLAQIIGVPPLAISLNGTLGIAFGSRGSGWASAHFEPSNLVINLTKTRGAGALAHEWFHALDNYFSRMRRDGEEAPFSGDKVNYNRENFITHRPERLMVPKARGAGSPMTQTRLEELRALYPEARGFAPENWQPDPSHPEGVRPEIEGRFADLVVALDESPMNARARLLDGIKVKGDGYWSRTLERAARAFENFVQARMLEQGFHNDFLVNVLSAEETGKSPHRYPYLMPGEVKAISRAFDALFREVETRETDRGVALFSMPDGPPRGPEANPQQARPRAGLSVSEVEKAIGRAVLAIADAIGLKVRVVADQAELPADIQSEIPPGRRPYGLLAPDGTVYLIAANLPNAKAARVALAHEVIGHVGMNAIIPDWKAVRERLSWLVKSGNKRAADIDREVRRRYPDVNADTYAREFIAVAAERRVKDGPLGEILSQIRAAIRRLLTKLGIVQAFPDWEIDVWLSDSANYIRSGRPKPGMDKGGVSFSQQDDLPPGPLSKNTMRRLLRQAFRGWEPVEVPRVRASQRLAKLVEQLGNGEIDETTFANSVRLLTDELETAKRAKRRNRLERERERGADLIRERLLAARRRGDLGSDMVEFALWALEKNPALAENLGISIRQAPEGEMLAVGDYQALNEIMRVFKGESDSETAVHEILHHAERMMPIEMQNRIRRDWARALARAVKAASPEQRAALLNIVPAMSGDQGARRDLKQAFLDGVLTPEEHYQLTNPSEFWAVNASRLLWQRFEARDNIYRRILNWLRELVQRVKSLLGARADGQLLRALDQLLDRSRNDGEFVSDDILTAMTPELRERVMKGQRLQSYGGVGSSDTAALANRGRAERMISAGLAPEIVRFATGWFKGPYDGKWRYEFSDANARMTPAFDGLEQSQIFGEEKTLKLREVLDHPALYKAYPSAGDIDIVKRSGFLDFGGLQGWFDGKNQIGLTPYAQDKLSTLIHEVQHWIQSREGFAAGGNENLAFETLTQDRKEYLAQRAIEKSEADAAELIEAVSIAERGLKLPELAASLEATKAFYAIAEKTEPENAERREKYRILNEAEKAFRNALFGGRGFFDLSPAEQRAAGYFVSSSLKDVEERIARAKTLAADAREKAAKLRSGDAEALKSVLRASGDLYKLYRAIAGEVEARDVQARQSMSEEARRSTKPFSSEDIDPADVIVVFDSAVESASVERQGDTSSPSFDSTARTYGGREAYERAKAAGRTKLTYGQWVQVRTPEFKAWFGDWENDLANASAVNRKQDGRWYYNTVAVADAENRNGPDRVKASPGADASPLGETPLAEAVESFVRQPFRRVNPDTVSKVTDPETGEPLVVYHGTTGNFPQFDFARVRSGDELGVFTTADPAVAAGYADRDGGNIMPLHLSIKNPYEMDNDERMMRQVFGAEFDEGGTTGFVKGLMASDYDGIFVPGDPNGQTEEEMADQWIAFRPEQIKSAIGNRGTFDGQDPRVQFMFDDGFDLPSESTFDYLVRNLQDRFRRVKILQRAIREAGGEVTPESDAYLKEEIFHGKVGARIETFMRDRVEPLLKSMQAAGVTLEELDDYLYAKHAPERNARIAEIRQDMPDGGSGMTTDEATAYIASLPREQVAKLEALARRVWAINQARVDLLEEAGLESPEQLAEWRAGYQFYVPLRGFSDTELSESMMSRAARRLGRGFDIRGKESRRALGRSSRSDSPLVYSIAQMQESIVRAAKNEVGQAFLRLVEENPNPDLWTVHTGEMGDYKPAWDARRGEVVYRRDRMKKLADNVLSVKRDGKEHFIVMEDQGALLARAFKNLGVDNSNAVVRFFAGYNRYMAAINTSLNPEFVLTNFARDLQTAAINLVGEQDARGMLREPRQMGRKVLKDIPKAMRGAFLGLYNRSPNDPWVRWFNEFRDAGGMINFYSLNDLEGLRAELKRTIDASRAGAPKRVLNALRALGRHMGNTNSAVENAVRLSTYANARRAGFSQDQAASLARNVTVNFTRKGEYGNVANAAYLFYNASLQGSVRLLYAISKSRRVRAILGGLAASALVWGLLNRMLAGDDDDGENRYDKIPNYIKTRNIIFMRPDGSYWKWPLPYGYNVPWVLGTYAENALAHPEKRMEGAVVMAQAILESFNPLGGLESEDGFKAAAKLASPTIADPWVEMAINEDWAGRPIRREQHDRAVPLPDNQLYWSSVSQTSKSLTASLNELTGGNEVVPGAIDLNPETLDHLFSALTGGLGRAIGAGIDIPLTKAQGDALKTDQIPFVRRFVGEPSESYTFRRYDEIKDGVQLYSKRHKAMLQDADTRGEARSYREQNRVNRIMEPSVKASESQLSTLYRQRKAVERSALDEATKKTRLERFDQQIETVRKRVIRRYNEVAAEAAGKPKAQVIDLSKDPRALEIRRDYRDKRISGEEARRRLEALKAG